MGLWIARLPLSTHTLPPSSQTPASFVDRLPSRFLRGNLSAWQAHLAAAAAAPGASGIGVADTGSVDADPSLDPINLCPPQPLPGTPPSPAAAAAVDLSATLGVPPVLDDFYGRPRGGAAAPVVAGALLWVNASDLTPVQRPRGRGEIPPLPPIYRLAAGPCR